MDILSFEKVFFHPKNIYEVITKGDTYPVHLDLGLINICDHDCIWCFAAFSKRKKDEPIIPIDKNRLLEIIKEMHEHGLKSCTLVGSGEPTLHPEFVRIVKGIKNIGVDVGLLTNGSLVKGEIAKCLIENATFVRVSLNGADKEMHQRIHGTYDFDKIIENIKTFVKMRGENIFPTIGIQFVVHSINYNQIEKIAILAKDLGVNYLEYKPTFDAPEKKINRKMNYYMKLTKKILKI